MKFNKNNWRNDVKDYLYLELPDYQFEKVNIDFKIKDSQDILSVETNRPDLIFGVSFILLPENLKDKYNNLIAINPFNKEEIPLYFKDVIAPRIGVPAHINEDYDFALENNIEIKQVIMPVNTSMNENAPRDDKEWTFRETVVLVVKHWEEEKYLYIAYNKYDWKCLITGGIENDESKEEAAIRELQEESGFYDLKLIKPLPFVMANVFYAAHKGVNRYINSYGYYIELASNKQYNISEEEAKEHTIMWETKDKLIKIFENGFTDCVWLLKQSVNEIKAYNGNGKYINSDFLNDIEDREEAYKKVISELSKE